MKINKVKVWIISKHYINILFWRSSIYDNLFQPRYLSLFQSFDNSITYSCL